MTHLPKGSRPKQGYSPVLARTPLGDPRDRQNVSTGISAGDISPPLVMDSQDRATVLLNINGPLVIKPGVGLDLSVGAGLTVQKGSPPSLQAQGSDSVMVNAQGIHARPKASQVRDDSGVGAGSLADTLKNGVELLVRKDQPNGYAALDARGKLTSAHGAATSSVATLDTDLQVPGAQLGGLSFGGAGTKVLVDASPPIWGAVPVGAIPGHHVTHETGGSDELTSLSAAILTSGLIPAARVFNVLQLTDLSDVSATTGNGTTSALFGGSTPPTLPGAVNFTGQPVIIDFTSANHDHRPGDPAGGGTLDATAIASGTLPIARGGTGNATGTATVNANLTGPITSVGNATAIASQTGTGTKFVMDTSPTLVTPLLGTPTSGNLVNCTGYPASAPAAHHVSHETGGSDALAHLSASILDSGTLPAARIPSTTVSPGTYAAFPGLVTSLAIGADGRITNASDGVISTDYVNITSVGTSTFLGRKTAGTGACEDLSVSDAKTLLSLTGTNSGDQTITLTGAVTGSGTGSFATAVGTIPGRLIKRTLLTSGTGATFTFQAATTMAFVQLWGGGAGGGGASHIVSDCGAAGGGGSGGYADILYTSITGSSTKTYTVPSAAGGGTAGANDGTGGSSTTFDNGGTIVTAKGGSAGKAGAASAVAAINLGGGGAAVSTNGDLNAGGAPGNNGVALSATLGYSGFGGSTAVGMGGGSRGTEAAGIAATGFGAGGGGALSLGTNDRAGGNGAPGLIVVWEFS